MPPTHADLRLAAGASILADAPRLHKEAVGLPVVQLPDGDVEGRGAQLGERGGCSAKLGVDGDDGDLRRKTRRRLGGG